MEKETKNNFDCELGCADTEKSDFVSSQTHEILLVSYQNIYIISAYSFALIVLGFVLVKALYQSSKLNEQKKTN